MRKFSEIIGQKAIIEHLQNALRTGSISHAYMISGDAGSGRRTIASIFAAAMQCADLQEEPVSADAMIATVQAASASAAATQSGAPASQSGAPASQSGAPASQSGTPTSQSGGAPVTILEPCGNCLSCLQAQSGNQPDIITVTHAKPNSIGIDEIRRMRADLQIKPYAGPHKIYIIPDAEKLTIPAQNALLKTLEEPPEYAVILLIADGTSTFLPTVLSRCILLQTRAVEEAQIARFLEQNKSLPRDQAQVLARFAGGNPGRALLLVDDHEFLELRDRTVDFLAHIATVDAMQISEFAAGIDPPRREAVLTFVLMWFRDVLLYLSVQNSDSLIFQEDIQYIIEAADQLGFEQVGVILDEVDTASRRLRSNVPADAVFEVLFLKIRAEYRRRT